MRRSMVAERWTWDSGILELTAAPDGSRQTSPAAEPSCPWRKAVQSCPRRISLTALVTVSQQPSEIAEDAAFVAALAEAAGGVGEDAAGQAREGERLHPHLAGAGERREEQSLAAEQGVLDPAHHLDVVVDARLHGDEAAGVEAKGLTGLHVALDDGSAGVDHGDAVAGEALHDEALAAE